LEKCRRGRVNEHSWGQEKKKREDKGPPTYLYGVLVVEREQIS